MIGLLVRKWKRDVYIVAFERMYNKSYNHTYFVSCASKYCTFLSLLSHFMPIICLISGLIIYEDSEKYELEDYEA